MQPVIDSLGVGVPRVPTEFITLGKGSRRRILDVVTYFGRPQKRNNPTEPINGRPEHPLGIARGYRNLTHYIARSLLETGEIATGTPGA